MNYDLVLDFYYSSGQSVELLRVERADYRFQYIEDFFQSRWLHNDKETMRVVRILEVRQDAETMRSYEDYKWRFTGERGKESFQLHGTNRQCMLGEDDDEVTPCDSSLCYLCCILRHSFDVAQSGKKFSFKRFGHGIYLTPVSSKAHDYVDNHLPPDAPEASKVMILARVVLGRQIALTTNGYYLRSPPRGYDSVIGRPGVHPDMNYEETVVYNNDAVRPAYLIVYETDTRDEETYPETSYVDGQVQESYTSDEDEEDQYPQINDSDDGEVPESVHGEELEVDCDDEEGQNPETNYSDDEEVQEFDPGDELELEVDEDEDEDQDPGTNYDNGQFQDSYTSDEAEAENEEGQDPETNYCDDGEVQEFDPGEELEEEQYPEIRHSDDAEVQESDAGGEAEVEVEAEEYEEQDSEVNYDSDDEPVQEPDASDEDEEVIDEEQDFAVDDDVYDISDDDYDGSDDWDD